MPPDGGNSLPWGSHLVVLFLGFLFMILTRTKVIKEISTHAPNLTWYSDFPGNC